jgi:PAS domain S-box-containing protein
MEADRAREDLAYYLHLLDCTDDAIVALDADWMVTVWNQGAERMYGWTAEEVLGRPIAEVAHQDLSDAERARLRGAAAKQGIWRGEVVAYRKDGTPVEVELITVAVRDDRGEVTGFLGIHRNVTGRREADAKLHEAQQRNETILESIGDAFVAVDRDWRYTYVNDRALRRMRGRRGDESLSRESLLGRNMWEMFPDAVGSELHDRYREAMRLQQAMEFEAYFEPTDEWIEAHVYPSEEGLSIYYREVTERKRDEQELERSARRQALVAELGLRALASDQLDPLLEEGVAMVARMLEVELAGVGQLGPGGDQVRLRAGVGWGPGVVGSIGVEAGRASLVGYTLTVGAPVVSEDLAGDERFAISSILSSHGVVSGASVPIPGRKDPVGALGVFSRRRRSFSNEDVSFLQSVANVLATAAERVEAGERAMEIRDVERRRIARDLHDEALQDLAAAQARAGAGEVGAALERVGRHLQAAIYDLRLAGEEDQRFPELLQTLVELHRGLVRECKIELEVGDGVPPGSLGKRGTEILRVVGEALVNARRHSEAATIRVAAWGAEDQLCLEVCDDGRGFDPTQRMAPSGGAGIVGMRERAALLGGRLEVHSEPGTGTRVRLEVALTPAHTVQGEARVLLVEDHKTVREAIAAMFEREPDFAIAGQAGTLAQARGMLEDVDVAILDLGLPDGYGGDLIAPLRAASPAAQVLVLSASLDREELARAVESGAAGALHKNVHLHELVDTVRRLRAGETLLSMDEILDLLRHARTERERERGDRQALDLLTPREREVLQGLADGLDSQSIADRLGVAIRTERNHVANILAKLGVHTQIQALVFALRYGAVQLR